MAESLSAMRLLLTFLFGTNVFSGVLRC